MLKYLNTCILSLTSKLLNLARLLTKFQKFKLKITLPHYATSTPLNIKNTSID